MYYIDRYLGRLVNEIDPYAPPERYIEYREGVMDDVVKERYIVSYNPLEVIDFAYSTNEDRNILNVKRNIFFKMHNLPNDLVLIAYTVPSEWYKEEVAKIKNNVN